MGYSLDFRRHVLDFKEKHNLTFEETSQHFEISIRSLFRWSKKIEPCTTRNKAPTKIDTQKLLEDIQAYPNAFNYQRAERLGVSSGGIFYALKRLKNPHKKTTTQRKKVEKV